MTSALLKNVGALVEQLQCLARQAHVEYSSEVDAIIRSKSRDSRRIEHLLDGILDFCFDEEMLRLYKKLSRYYYFIDPAATATYVNFYREMWDNDSTVGPRLSAPRACGHRKASRKPRLARRGNTTPRKKARPR